MLKQLHSLLAPNESATLSVSKTDETKLRVVVNFIKDENAPPPLLLEGTPEEIEAIDLTPVAVAHKDLATAVAEAAEATTKAAAELRTATKKKSEKVKPVVPVAATPTPTGPTGPMKVELPKKLKEATPTGAQETLSFDALQEAVAAEEKK